MASAAGSRSGLITATVILAIVAVTALVFTFIFSAKATRNELALEEMTKAYNDVVRRAALRGPVVSALDTERKDSGSQDPLLDFAVRQRDDLSKLVGGATPSAAMASAAEALTEAGKQVQAFKATPPSTTDNIAATIRSMTNIIVELQNKNTDLSKAAADAKAQAEETIKTTTAQMEAVNKQLADVRKQAEASETNAQAVTASHQDVLNQNATTIENQNRSYTTALTELQTQLDNAQRLIARTQAENKTVLAKYNAVRPDAQQSTLRAPDGTVVRNSADGTISISLGAGQQIVPGMTFEVYDRGTGVPAIAATDDLTMPKGKASLEVLRVGPTTSECRVVRLSPASAIAEGDIIANIVYDKNTKYNFVVYGNFDLARDGNPSQADTTIIKRLITEWGGKLQNEVGVGTDFLVIGAEPVIPDFTEEQRRDPVNAKILSDKQAEFQAYVETLNKARELYIPILNQNRFLYYTGYYNLAKR